MKNFAKLLVLSSSMLAMYATANEATFTGPYVGGELQLTKHRFSVPSSEFGWFGVTANSKINPGIAIVTGYGFDYSNNFVGLVNGKLVSNNAKTKNKELVATKANFGTEISYLQGYRIADSFLPYIKLGISTLSYKINDDLLDHNKVGKQRDGIAVGFNYGVGMKFAVSQNIVAGVELSQSSLRDHTNTNSYSIKYKINTVGANLSYFF